MQKQHGMTLIGILLVVIVIMLGIALMRSIPVYLTHYYVVKSIKELNTIPRVNITDDSLANIEAMKESLNKHFEINGINDFKMEHFTFKQTGGDSYTVLLKYQVTQPLFYNISLLFKFDDTIEVQPGSEN